MWSTRVETCLQRPPAGISGNATHCAVGESTSLASRRSCATAASLSTSATPSSGSDSVVLDADDVLGDEADETGPGEGLLGAPSSGRKASLSMPGLAAAIGAAPKPLLDSLPGDPCESKMTQDRARSILIERDRSRWISLVILDDLR